MPQETIAAYHYSPTHIPPEQKILPHITSDPCVPPQLWNIPLVWFTTQKDIVFDKSGGTSPLLYVYTLLIHPEIVEYWDFDILGWAATKHSQDIHSIETISNPNYKPPTDK